MEKKKKLAWVWILVISLIVLSCFAAVLYRVIKLVIADKRTQNSTPVVQITSPNAGETVPANTSILVNATATGRTPIMRIELWLDGQIVEQSFNQAASSGAFDGQFMASVADGGHLLVARAVDQDGLIGQSVPIPVYGSSLVNDMTTLVYPAKEGDTLGGIANDFGLDIETVNGMNPALGAGGLAGGTVVNLPIRDDDNTQPQQPPASVIQPEPIAIPDAVLLPAVIPPNPIAAAWGALTALKLPQAPSDLRPVAIAADCRMSLYWLDNSDSEDYFRVWMAGLGVPARVIATVSSSTHTGPVWYRFDIPPAGIYSFWVEAVNGLGAQPSEIEWVGVPATQCKQYTAAYLELEVTKIRSLGGQYDRYYCYLSVEGAPERRFPADDSQFFFGGWFMEPTDITMYLYGNNVISIPIPEDDVLNLEGECLAWIGDNLIPIGQFSKSVPSSSWDGAEQVIDEPSFKISFTVNPFGSMEAKGEYTYMDEFLKPAYNLKDVDTGRRGNPFLPTDHILTWEWDGNEKDITGFTVHLNDSPYKIVMPNERQVLYTPTSDCAAPDQYISVSVNTNHGETVLSDYIKHNQKPCPLQLEIQFVSIETGETYDSFEGKCDQIETYFNFTAWGANTVTRNLGVGSGYSVRYPMVCNSKYLFNDIGYALTRKRNMDKLIVQIDPNNPYLQIGFFGWDYDWGTMNDPLIIEKILVDVLPVDNWQGFEDEVELRNTYEAGSTLTIIRIKALPGP